MDINEIALRVSLARMLFDELRIISIRHKADVLTVVLFRIDKTMCFRDGMTDGSVCSVCGEILEPCQVIPALAHKPGSLLGTPATCTEEGWTDGIACQICGHVMKAKEKIAKLPHTPAAAVNAAKQRRIIASAALYLQSTRQSDEPVRFDVAEVVPLDSGRWMVHIIKGAFTA